MVLLTISNQALFVDVKFLFDVKSNLIQLKTGACQSYW